MTFSLLKAFNNYYQCWQHQKEGNNWQFVSLDSMVGLSFCRNWGNVVTMKHFRINKRFFCLEAFFCRFGRNAEIFLLEISRTDAISNTVVIKTRNDRCWRQRMICHSITFVSWHNDLQLTEGFHQLVPLLTTSKIGK